MTEYINREAAIKAIEKADYTAIADDADSCKADYLREIIESVPAADVAPVVHGKDCKHAIGRWSDLVCCVYNYPLMRPDDFCSYGERRDGGANDD